MLGVQAIYLHVPVSPGYKIKFRFITIEQEVKTNKKSFTCDLME